MSNAERKSVDIDSEQKQAAEPEVNSALEDAMADALNSVEKREKSKDIEMIIEEPKIEGPEESSEELGDGEVLVATAETDEIETPTEEDDPLHLLQAENAELKEARLRLAADFENFRKRKQREMDDARQFGIAKLLGDLLPVVDNMQRALDHAPEASDPVIDGIKMVAKQFEETLKRQGVNAFDSMGQLFDPELHEAMSQAPSADHPANTIIFEMERGYMIHEKLLRPSKVVVSTEVQEESSGKNDEDENEENNTDNSNKNSNADIEETDSKE
ncbi:nucleotide exchange factor GrpE [Myxococcota bacterium]|nr:nucleotide exchange factor GrpE [Myxococcota bacterium]